MVFIDQPPTVTKSNTDDNDDGRPASNLTRLRGRQIFFKERSKPFLKVFLLLGLFAVVVLGIAAFAFAHKTDQSLLAALLEVFQSLTERLIDKDQS